MMSRISGLARPLLPLAGVSLSLLGKGCGRIEVGRDEEAGGGDLNEEGGGVDFFFLNGCVCGADCGGSGN